jgi:hypothetical protein
MSFNFVRHFVCGYRFESSFTISKNQKDIYRYIKDTENWYKIDFHELIYFQKDIEKTIINTRIGRGILVIRTDDLQMQLRYTIHDFIEGTWKFAIKVESYEQGARLYFKCKAPRGLPSSVFYHRISAFENQLMRLKDVL